MCDEGDDPPTVLGVPPPWTRRGWTCHGALMGIANGPSVWCGGRTTQPTCSSPTGFRWSPFSGCRGTSPRPGRSTRLVALAARPEHGGRHINGRFSDLGPGPCGRPTSHRRRPLHTWEPVEPGGPLQSSCRDHLLPPFCHVSRDSSGHVANQPASSRSGSNHPQSRTARPPTNTQAPLAELPPVTGMSRTVPLRRAVRSSTGARRRADRPEW